MLRPLLAKRLLGRRFAGGSAAHLVAGEGFRSYRRWNIAGILVAVTGFAVGSLRGMMHGGGAHTAVGATLGIVGAAMALTAYLLERRTRGAGRRA